jgi:hypothetical protein
MVMIALFGQEWTHLKQPIQLEAKSGSASAPGGLMKEPTATVGDTSFPAKRLPIKNSPTAIPLTMKERLSMSGR